MSAIGDELVTLEQFKRVVSGGGGMEEAMQDSDVVPTVRAEGPGRHDREEQQLPGHDMRERGANLK